MYQLLDKKSHFKDKRKAISSKKNFIKIDFKAKYK